MPQSTISTIEQPPDRKSPGVIPLTTRLKKLPWWGLVILFLGASLVYAITTLPNYADAFEFISPGLKITLVASLSAFSIALVVGLIVGLGRISDNVIAYNISTFYVEVVRCRIRAGSSRRQWVERAWQSDTQRILAGIPARRGR